MGILTWAGGALVAFVAAQLLDFGRFHPVGEIVVALSGGFTAGMAATWLDFGGFAEADLRAFLFSTIVAFLSIGLARLTLVALKWPESGRRGDGTARHKRSGD